LLLFIWAAAEPVTGQETQPVNTAATQDQADPSDPAESLAQATGTIRELVTAFYALLPKIGLGLLLIGVAALAARLARLVLRRTLGRWERTDALATLAGIGFYLIAHGHCWDR
jgi:hypothetical protein